MALDPDALIAEGRGVMLNGLYLKFTGSGRAEHLPAAGLYRVDAPVVIDGASFSRFADGA